MLNVIKGNDIRMKKFTGADAAFNFNEWMQETENKNNTIEGIDIKEDHGSIIIVYRAHRSAQDGLERFPGCKRPGEPGRA